MTQLNKDNIVSRFLKYVGFYTTSDEESGTVPSTERQLELGAFLRDEMTKLGLSDVKLDEYGYVYGYLPPKGCDENVGLIAHIDTAPDAPGENVKARIVKYTGDAIELSEGVFLSKDNTKTIDKYMGEDLIVTDGTTLLGADDKAGVCEIMSCVEYYVNHPEENHRGISVCFTPDEEIGSGADLLDLDFFKAKVAYTVDGGEIGGVEYENFNAASCTVEVRGVEIHPGEAKDVMKSSIMMAADFVQSLPKDEAPWTTEGYEGFYHVRKFSGEVPYTRIEMLVREHDKEKFENRKAFLYELCDRMNEKYGEDYFKCTITDSYYNMKEKLAGYEYLLEDAKAAFEACGIKYYEAPVRGGTDGARLSWRGLPTPNLSTGGVNFHSCFEFIPVSSLVKMSEVLCELVKK